MTQREFRKKSFIILGLTVLLLICMVWDTTAFRHSSGESSSAATKTTKTASSVSTGSALVTDVQAVWISFGDYKAAGLYNKSQSAFQTNANKYFKKLKKDGINTIYFHVAPCNDAIYPSKYLKWSSYMFESAPDYDPLEILIQTAHKNKMTFHAWLNPYRKKMGVSYDPGKASSLKRIRRIVAEIVQNYNVDGIHFDDYFYPTTAPDFDADSYAASGSTISLADWRRQNVNDLMRACYAAAHAFNVRFGVSPQGTLSGCRDGQYSDAALWLAKPGYCDYLIPQLYWGLNYRKNGSDALSLGRLAAEWLSLPRTESVQLAFGLGAYRIGDGDEGDTSGPGTEWCTGHALATQATTLRSLGASGAALYRYAFLFANTLYPTLAEQEIAALREVWG